MRFSSTSIRFWIIRAKAWDGVVRKTPMTRHEASAAWVKALELLLVRTG